ncbi:chromosome segregation protein SMC [Pediococcus ethanolidurans]|uniref:chromosome segregation protein SMC n=2 Tax=Pediococcus ethanolidurans TaxID=319653 RepID=UPI0021E7B993|nr:chromosome segregation protein SMC [Pediococcus ethanolidurans]MCV3315419.1 chromosome segregation protein SMC [Pediococcus ethanolidurans]
MNDLDKLENYKTELTKQIGEAQQKIENNKLVIANLQSEYDRTVMKQLRAMGDDKRLQTSSWRYNRSIADPSKATWWRVVKTDNTKSYKVVKTLELIDPKLINKTASISGIKKMIANGRFKPTKYGNLVDVETGQMIPYRAELRPDRLNVKAVEK